MFLDVGLSSALDRTKMSNRQAIHVLSAAAVSLGHDPAKLVMNRESFRRERIKFRQISAAEIKAGFSPDAPLTVHWDGKIFQPRTVGHVRTACQSCFTDEKLEKVGDQAAAFWRRLSGARPVFVLGPLPRPDREVAGTLRSHTAAFHLERRLVAVSRATHAATVCGLGEP
ncbi:hypothetical protein FJT64_007241 [Amphibalanus amphitrite]|uniref:Uncharacterized protein n=1 Tax=Amphibalanus amphitrite TaxID=1232801 RepID=A0A6A4VQA1_AMPAM|nr:hypothetical protein FJT64_007241 [Amphibalanus amphitrite]